MITHTTSFLRSANDEETIAKIYDEGGSCFLAGVADEINNVDVFSVLNTGTLHRLSDFIFTHGIEPENFEPTLPLRRWPFPSYSPTIKRIFHLIIHPFQMYNLRADPRYADLFGFSDKHSSLLAFFPGSCLLFHDIRHPPTTFVIYQSELVRCPNCEYNPSKKRLAILMGKDSNIFVATWAENPFHLEKLC